MADQRPRSRTPRQAGAATAAALVLVLGAAGCRPPGGTSAAGDSASPAPGAAAELRQASGVTGSAGSARVVLEESLVSDGKTATVHGEGVTRLGGAGNGRFTVTADGRAMELRIVDEVVYEQLPAAQHTGGGTGRSWVRIDAANADAQGTTGIPDVSRQLAFLTQVTDVTRLGQEGVDGAATVHCRGRLDLGTGGAQMLGAPLPSGVPVDVWGDDRHRIRQEKVRLDVTATDSDRGDGSATASPRAAAEVVLHLTDFSTA